AIDSGRANVGGGRIGKGDGDADGSRGVLDDAIAVDGGVHRRQLLLGDGSGVAWLGAAVALGARAGGGGGEGRGEGEGQGRGEELADAPDDAGGIADDRVDGDAVVAGAGEDGAVAGGQGLGAIDTAVVADGVLRDRSPVADQVLVLRAAADVEDRGEGGGGGVEELAVAALEELGVASAADQAAEKDGARRRAVGPQLAVEDGAEDRRPLAGGDEEAEAVERMADLLAVI